MSWEAGARVWTLRLGRCIHRDTLYGSRGTASPPRRGFRQANQKRVAKMFSPQGKICWKALACTATRGVVPYSLYRRSVMKKRKRQKVGPARCDEGLASKFVMYGSVVVLVLESARGCRCLPLGKIGLRDDDTGRSRDAMKLMTLLQNSKHWHRLPIVVVALRHSRGVGGGGIKNARDGGNSVSRTARKMNSYLRRTSSQSREAPKLSFRVCFRRGVQL